MATIAPINHIEITDDGFGGTEPVIAGTRITVHEIAGMHVMGGTSVDTISELFVLTPAQIYAALAYYFDHRAQIDSELAEADRLMRELGEPLSS